MVQKGFIKKFKKIVELNVQWTFSERFDQNPEIKCSEPTFSERSENVGIWTLNVMFRTYVQWTFTERLHWTWKCYVVIERSLNVQWTFASEHWTFDVHWTFTERSLNVVWLSGHTAQIIYWWIPKSNNISKDSCCEVEYDA